MKEKDEQNVRRRIYDALNVMIAAGIVKKEGKMIWATRTRQRNKGK